MAIEQAGENWREWLARHQIRATTQRVAVLKALARLPHPDAESIYHAIRGQSPGYSLATVYNTLERFRQRGLVQVVDIEGRRHYDLRGDRHDHLFCQQCGALVDSPAAHAGPEPEAGNWQIEGVTVVWRGTCPDCAQNVR